MKLEKTKDDYIFTYQIKTGKRYRIRYSYSINGRREIFDKSGISTLTEARYLLKNFRALSDNKSNVLSAIRTTVSDYWQIFSEKKTITGQWSSETETHFKRTINKILLPRWGNYRLHEIERNEYELWISNLLTRYRRSSVRTFHKDFMALLNDAVYNMTLEKNPLMHINIGKSQIPPKNKEVSVHDFKIWISTAEKNLPRWQYTMVLLASFGLRKGEILGIRPNRVKTLNNGLLEIYTDDSRSEVNKNGKGGVKTESSKRYVVLNKKASELLLWCISEAKEFCIIHYSTILSDSDYLWLNRKAKTKTWINPGQFDQMFKVISKETGIHISAHMLRHFFVTQSIASGISMEDVARYVGHSQKYMTEAYTHIRNESAQRVVNGYSDFLGL